MVLELPSVRIPCTGVNQISISLLLLAEKGSVMPCTYQQLMESKKEQ